MSGGWYYATAEGAQGPLEEAELFRLIDAGTIHEETLLWKDGMAVWTPAEQLAVLEVARHRHEPDLSAPEFVHRPRATLRPSPPDPFRRYAARSLDFFILRFFAAPLIGEVDWAEPNQVAPVLAVLYLAWALIESVLISTLGATPGKWLLRIEVSDAYGNRLGYFASLRRALDVSVRGMGLGLPYLHLFAQLFGLYQLTGRGITPWDRSGSCVVKHGPLELSRWLIFLFLVLWIFQSGTSFFGAR